MKPPFKSIATRGFVGPKYRGILGKVKFAAESRLWRRELVLCVTPRTLVPALPSESLPLELVHIRRYEDLEPYQEIIDSAYGRPMVSRWKGPLSWGEKGVIATVDGEVAGFNWMQQGTARGYPTYYGRMFRGEARILRGGVLPAWRRRGVNKRMKTLVLQEFFEAGIHRVWAETYRNNIPTIKTLNSLGFHPVGELSVLELPGLRHFVRWHSVSPEGE